MSGHSKWSTIKRKKGVNDAKRAQLFSKLVKEIIMAAKEGGSSPENNPRLRVAIQNAKGASLPKDNIDRAIKKSEDKDLSAYNEIVYEGYGPSGVAFIIECITDNINRTVSNVRAAFTKYGGSLAKNGSLSHLFDRRGTFVIEQQFIKNEDDFTLALIDCGADTLDVEDGHFYVTCDIQNFGTIQKELDALKLVVKSAEIQYIPNTYIPLDQDSTSSVEKLIDTLEDIDDVQKVYTNIAA